MNNFTEFFGLPLYRLLVHAVVVLVPLTVIALCWRSFGHEPDDASVG